MQPKDVHLILLHKQKKLVTMILSKIKSCIKLTGFVNSTDNFTEQPKVINGASDLNKINIWRCRYAY